MTCIKDCWVEFKQHQTVFKPGEKVFGKIYLALSEKLFCGRVEILFRGCAHVLWYEQTEPVAPAMSKKQVKFNGETVFFNERRSAFVYIEEEDDKGNKKRIRDYQKSQLRLDANQSIWVISQLDEEAEPGSFGSVQSNVGGRAKLKGETVSFDFSFRLPPNLAPSFSAKHAPASVQYYIEVSSPGFFRDLKEKRAFYTVAPVLDLTAIPEARLDAIKEETIELRKEHKISISGIRSSSFKSDPDHHNHSSRSLTTVASIPKQGYVPGESIPVLIDTMLSDTKKLVKSVSVRLLQLVSSFSKEPDSKKRTVEHTVAVVNRVFEVKRKEITAEMVVKAFQSGIRKASTKRKPSRFTLSLRQKSSRPDNFETIDESQDHENQPMENDQIGKAGCCENAAAVTRKAPSVAVQRWRTAVQRIILEKRSASVSSELQELIGAIAEEKGEKLQLYVPETVPSFEVSGSISVSYKVRVMAFMHRDGPADLSLDLPVIIGTVPVQIRHSQLRRNKSSDGGKLIQTGTTTGVPTSL